MADEGSQPNVARLYGQLELLHLGADVLSSWHRVRRAQFSPQQGRVLQVLLEQDVLQVQVRGPVAKVAVGKSSKVLEPRG